MTTWVRVGDAIESLKTRCNSFFNDDIWTTRRDAAVGFNWPAAMQPFVCTRYQPYRAIYGQSPIDS